MPITAKQSKNTNWNFDVASERLLRQDGSNTAVFANVRTDTNEILGTSTERYGIVQNNDLVDRAEDAFKARGINYERNIYTTDNGSKLRAVYDLKGPNMETRVPNVGDVMGYRLTVQNSFDRTLRVSFALGLMRLVCLNGMQTMEKDIDMVSKHSTKLDLANLITDKALDNALAFLKNSGSIYGRLAATKLEDEQGLNILQNLTKKKVMSEKVRERVAQLWNNRGDLLRNDEDSLVKERNKHGNLYNLYNAVTQHLTDDVEETRFEYSNRMSNQVLKAFDRATGSASGLAKLAKAIPNDAQVVVTA